MEQEKEWLLEIKINLIKKQLSNSKIYLVI